MFPWSVSWAYNRVLTCMKSWCLYEFWRKKYISVTDENTLLMYWTKTISFFLSCNMQMKTHVRNFQSQDGCQDCQKDFGLCDLNLTLVWACGYICLYSTVYIYIHTYLLPYQIYLLLACVYWVRHVHDFILIFCLFVCKFTLSSDMTDRFMRWHI